MTNKYRFKLNYLVRSEDEDLAVGWIRVEWKHGIYGTQEHEYLTVSVTDPDTDDEAIVIMDSTGTPLLPSDDADGFGDALHAFIEEAVIA